MGHWWEAERDEWAARNGYKKEYDEDGNIQYVGNVNGGEVIFRTTSLPETLEEERRREAELNKTCSRLVYARMAREAKAKE